MNEEVPVWGEGVVGFSWHYDFEGDVIYLFPVDCDDEVHYDLGFGFSAPVAGRVLSEMNKAMPDLYTLRRSVRKAEEKGVSAEEVDARYYGQHIVESVNQELKKMIEGADYEWVQELEGKGYEE